MATDAAVREFLDGVTHVTGRRDADTLLGCLYLKNLDEVDLSVLEAIVRDSYRAVTAGTYGKRARDGGTDP